MQVTVESYGLMKDLIADERRRVDVDVEQNATVMEVLRKVGVQVDLPWNASLNGTLADPSDQVSEGSLILVFPPIAGGS
ncbi:MAG: MoaD/ThiS family protein [Dehalococcoidia bacterium]|jgi:molybdopterin converting factor small subunit|nr:MoaD/ThiS family protein [Dehalococcoidia bacterium]